MTTKLLTFAAFLALCTGCQREPKTELDKAKDDVAASARAAQRDAEEARRTISKRLDKLDDEIEKLDQKAEKAKGKTRTKLRKEAQELRADARKLRDRMSTWDDKVESGWKTAKREVEEGLDKTENAIKNLVDDVKN